MQRLLSVEVRNRSWNRNELLMVTSTRVRLDCRLPGASRVLAVVFFAVAWPHLTAAATGADRAVLNVISQSDRALVSGKILYRNAVTFDLDLVIAIGSPADWPLSPDSPAIWWSEKQKLGLFLQEKVRPDRVYELALAAGSLDCGARIERATSTDTVIACLGEKSYQGLNQKFVYDIRAKALVSHFAYQPFAMMRALDVSGHTVFVGADLHRLLAVEFQPGGSPEFRILPKAESAPWLRRVKTAQESVGPELSQILYIVPDDAKPVRFGPSDAFFLRARVNRQQPWQGISSASIDVRRVRKGARPARNGQLHPREYHYRGNNRSSAAGRRQALVRQDFLRRRRKLRGGRLRLL